MQSRINTPALTLPGTLEAVRTIARATERCGVPRGTLELVHLRVGQINGCSVCVDLHSRMLEKLGESSVRIFTLAAWREASYYTAAERAALTLAEAATRLSDRADAVPDDVWNEAARHFDETALGALVVSIALANFFNRINVATRQISGDWVAKHVEHLVAEG
jgi:AhpD family alkylhydroperoxidase